MSTIDCVCEDGPKFSPSARLGRPKRRLNGEILKPLFAFVDGAVIVLIALVAERLCSGGDEWFGDLAKISTVSAVIFVTITAFRGGYRLQKLISARRQLIQVTVAWLSLFLVLAWTAFLFEISSNFSRPAVSFFFVFGWATLVMLHAALARGLKMSLTAGTISLSRCVAIGDLGEFDRFRPQLKKCGVEIVATHHISANTDCTGAGGKLRIAIARSECDSVLLFAPWQDQHWLDELFRSIGSQPVPVVLMADIASSNIISRRHVQCGAFHGFEVQPAPLGRINHVVKRLLDLAIASTALLVFAPILIVVSLAILIESGRPVLFRQNRRGFGGRIFEIYKFRSMTVQQNGRNIPQARRNDPRVTPLGRILRKTSFDELPQLINVLRGEMSIVGPRPHATAHDDQYNDMITAYAYRQNVKPGITGWAQANGLRGEIRELSDIAGRVEYDLWYINNWSIWLDLKIIFRTPLNLLSQRNAY